MTLDPDVAAQLKGLVHRTGKPFKSVLNDTIRKGLANWGKSSIAKPFRVKARDCRLRPGLDDRRFNQLADELDVEAVAGKLDRAR